MESIVRQWIEREQGKYMPHDVYDEHDIFLCAMFGLGNFLIPKLDIYKEAKTQFQDRDICERYGGDAALFELGCHLYVCIDLWLFNNMGMIRERVAQYIFTTFIDIFSVALKHADVYRLFVSRIEKYGELFRDAVSPETMVFHLTELILRARDNTAPMEYSFLDSEPITLKFESIPVKIALLTWMTHTLPATIKTLEICCNNFVPRSR